MKNQSEAHFYFQGKKIYCKIIEQKENIIVVKSLSPVNEDLGFIQTDSETRNIIIKN